MDFKFGEFKHNSAGIIEKFKSAEMQSVLAEIAENIASGANSMADINSDWRLDHEPYVGESKVLDKTAIGVARTTDKQAAFFDAKHQFLAAQNH